MWHVTSDNIERQPEWDALSPGTRTEHMLLWLLTVSGAQLDGRAAGLDLIIGVSERRSRWASASARGGTSPPRARE